MLFSHCSTKTTYDLLTGQYTEEQHNLWLWEYFSFDGTQETTWTTRSAWWKSNSWSASESEELISNQSASKMASGLKFQLFGWVKQHLKWTRSEACSWNMHPKSCLHLDILARGKKDPIRLTDLFIVRHCTKFRADKSNKGRHWWRHIQLMEREQLH